MQQKRCCILVYVQTIQTKIVAIYTRGLGDPSISIYGVLNERLVTGLG